VFQVKFVVDDNEVSGVAVDLTCRGLRLRTDEELEEGMQLDLSIITPNYETIDVEGDVRWVVELSPVPYQHQSYSNEAGIHISKASDALNALFDSHSNRFVDFRDWPRFPHRVRLELTGPGLWETTFALNLSRRGLFILTRQEVRTGQMLQLRLSLDNGAPDSLQLNAEVVYFLTESQASEIGAAPGVGVRLGKVDPGVKEKYYEFIDQIEEDHGK